jgi:hypothetical protein
LEHRAGQPDLVEHRRVALERQQPRTCTTGRRLQVELPRDLGRRAQAPAFEHAAHVRMLGAVVGEQAQKAELRAIFVVGGNKGALALPPTTRFSAASSSMALRTVPWLTL